MLCWEEKMILRCKMWWQVYLLIRSASNICKMFQVYLWYAFFLLWVMFFNSKFLFLPVIFPYLYSFSVELVVISSYIQWALYVSKFAFRRVASIFLVCHVAFEIFMDFDNVHKYFQIKFINFFPLPSVFYFMM